MSRSKKRSLVPANIEQLNPYIPGKTIAEVVDTYHPKKISKLASNENRLGCSSKVQEAVLKSLRTVSDYPDPLSKKLTTELSTYLGVEQDRIIVGAGSESLLSNFFKTFFLNKENLITADATFIGVFVQAKIRGVQVKRIPLTKEYGFDVKGIVNAIDEDTKVIYIANPNNPTGTYINQDEFEWLMEQVPEEVLVIMDEAYYEFASELNDYPDVLGYDFENLVVFRTFSKAYGLASLRVGYAIASKEVSSYMHKTKLPFEPSGVSQAGALAALLDQEFLEKSKKTVSEGREFLYTFFDSQKVNYVKSSANFVIMIFESEEEAIFLTEEMLKKGVILRRINAFGLPKCVRVTIGIKEELEHFKEAFLEINS